MSDPSFSYRLQYVSSVAIGERWFKEFTVQGVRALPLKDDEMEIEGRSYRVVCVFHVVERGEYRQPVVRVK